MKNKNLLNWLWTDSHEKQSPQRFARYAAMLIMLLTLGVGQMWADAFWPYAGFYEVYMTYSYSGNNSNYTFYASDNNSKQSVDLGTLTADFKVTALYMKCYKNTNDWNKSGNICGALMIYNTGSGDNEYQPTWSGYDTDKGWSDTYQAHLRELSKTGCNKVIASYNSGASGSYTANLSFKMWGSDDNGSDCGDNWWISNNSNNYKFKYKIAPPALNSFTITPTGKVAGSGTSGDPYIIPYGGDLTLVSSGGTKARTDANSSVQFSLNNSTWGTTSTYTTTTIENITSTSTTSVNLYARCKNNSDASLLGAVKTQTIYYRAAALNTITLNKGTDGTSAGSMTIREYATAYTSYTPATKTGWSLKGYYTTVSDGTQIIDANGNLLSNKSGYTNSSGQWIGGTTTLYAQWKQTYAVTYYANFPAGATSTSGSVPTDATEYASGATVTVKTNSGSLAAGGFTFAGWNTEAEGTGTDRAVSSTFSITGNTALYAQWTENMRSVTISVSPSGAGTLNKTSASVGVATTTTVSATAYPGYRFTGWTATNCSVASTSSANTTLSGNGTTGSGTLVANFVPTYAYLEGRMTVYNAARTIETHVGSSKGSWDESSTRVAMDYDATNHRFYRHTYKTPAELSATQTDGTAQNQWFSIARSNASGSWSGKTTYHPSSNTDLTTTGIEQKKAAQTSTTSYNYKFNSSVTNGYVILYFDEAGVWYELEHTLNYNGNGSTSGSAPSQAYYNHGANATAAAANTFSKTNYTFGGWNTAQYITGTNYVAGASVTMNSNTTLYAKWTRSITLNANGGGSGSTSVTATYNCATLPSITNPSKTGYTFGGWNTANDGSGNIVINTSGEFLPITGWCDSGKRFTRTASDATLYAKWTQTVTLNANLANHGSGDNTSATIVYKATDKSSITHCTPATGYHLEGYYTAATDGVKVLNADGSFASSSVTDYITDGKWTKAGTTTLYAHYEPNTYDVILNVNGATTGNNQTVVATFDAAMPTTQKTSGDAITAPSKTGYTFGGYWTNAAGTGTQYYTDGLASSHVWDVATNNTNIYAKWDANTYTITLDNQCAYTDGAHDGGPATEFEATYGSPSFTHYMVNPPSAYSLYTFGGWYSEVGGAGDQIITSLGQLVDGSSVYTTSGNWTHDDDVTVYAKWSCSLSTVGADKISPNGGSGGSIALIYNSSVVSGFTQSTRTGYIFQGYYNAAEGGDKIVNVNGTLVAGDVDGYLDDGKWIYNSASSLTLYAQWTPITYTISFDKNDDSSFLNSDIGDDPDNITATYDVDIMIPACPYTRAGYTFNGWSTAEHKAKGTVPVTDYDYRGDYPYRNLSSTQGAIVTLYPKWTGNLYTVSFNARGGSVYPTSMDVRYGETYGSGNSGSLPEPYDVPTGKAFIGWYTSPTGGTQVTASTQMATIGAHTLYARYSDIAMVYFKNTIGWDEVYVTYDAYWNNDKGTGNNGKTYHKMTQIYGTDVYFDRIPAACLSDWKYNIAFNSKELLNGGKHAPQESGDWEYYNSGEVVFRLDFDSRATMFVPKNVNTNNTDGNYQKNSAQYISTGYEGEESDPKYTSGYWMIFNNTYSGYLFSYLKNLSGSWSAEYGMNGAKAGDSVFVYSVKMDANTRYDLRIRKDCQTTNTKSRQFCYGTQITSGACTDLKLVCDPNNNSWMQTTAAGEYKFILTTKSDGHMYLTVEYPLAVNDYRVLYNYNDGSAKEYASEVVKPIAKDTIDTISVFVHKLQAPVVSRSMKIQKCTAINGSGVPTWSDVATGTIDLSSVTANGVYNFAVQQYESSTPTGAFIGKYDGDFYIRTEASDGGWDQYKDREGNVMTYSAYSMTQTLSEPYSHYYCRYVGSTSTDITFAVATKYSPNISGTMIGDAIIGNAATTLPANANVRFSWNEETNAMQRAYIKDAQGPSNERFMVMHGEANNMIFNPDGSAIPAAGSLAANELQFDDKGDWIYQVMLQAKPGAAVSIIAKYNGSDRYLIGGASSWETIMGGSGDSKYTIMAIYDFKTNRLMNAWTPDGDITDNLSDIDMLWIRHRQESAQQITFNGGSLSNVKAVGAIELRYNDLVGHVASWTPETRPLLRYFISFPFDVNVSDIFGLHGAEFGREYVIRKYDGAERAKNGLFLGDGDTYWIDLTVDSVMHAYEGYSLVFDNEYMNGDLGSVWENKTGGSSVYLYFPAAAEIASISDANKGTTLAEHLCQNTRSFDYKGATVSHANSDSHWNLIGSSLFVDSYVYNSSGTNGQAGDKERTTLDSYYAYNTEFNYWVPELYHKGGEYYACKAMHAMLVQFAGSVTWSKNVPPALAPSRERKEETVSNLLITLNLLQNGADGDRTYIKMDEDGNSDFMLCEDLFKIDNKKIPNIFSYASGNAVAYNKVAVESQTINLGIDIRKNDTYTFEMPENVAGQVTLIDNFAQTRTNLNMENYEIYLNKGNYYDRFSIEININKVPTAIDGVTDGQGSLKDGKAHKFIMNDQMYILKDGVLYDARGNRVK